MKKARCYKTSEVALLLRAKLGDIRCWEQALMEFRNQHGDMFGFRLLPCAKFYESYGWRPYYDEDDVNEFVRNIREVCSGATSKQPAQSRVLKYDTSKHWRVQKIAET